MHLATNTCNCSSMRSISRLIPVAAMGMAALCAAPGLGQDYLPAPAGKASLTGRNWLLPAQRSDLRMTCEHSFDTVPCPSSSEEVIKTCTVTVELAWMNDGRWSQAESDRDLGDPDDFVFYWEGFGHWSLKTATRNGNSVLAGATPEGSRFGNGTVDGLAMTVPNSFENGEDGPTEYEFVFEYVSDEECSVVPLKVSGHYIHKYEGSLRVRVKPTIRVSAGVGLSGPTLGASVSASPQWWFDKHAWQKQLFDPAGEEHSKKLEPSDSTVAHEDCCGKTYSSADSSSQVDMTVTEYNPAESTTVRTVVMAGDSPIQSVSVLAWSEDGIQVGALYHELDEPSWDPITLDVTAYIPGGSTPGMLHFVAITREANLSQSEMIIMTESGGAPGPIFGGDIVKDARLMAPGLLQMQLPLDGQNPQDLLELSLMYVVDQHGEIVDQEMASSYVVTADGVILYFETSKSEVYEREIGNGLVELLNHDTVQFSVGTDDAMSCESMPVVTDASEIAFNPFVAEGEDSNLLRFSGSAIGGRFIFDVGASSEPLVITTTPGESGQSVARRVVDAINEAGLERIWAELIDENGVLLDADSGTFVVLEVDGAMTLRLPTASVPPVPGDINQDQVVNGIDLSLMLGSWGICFGCPEDINDDGIVDGIDLATLLGNWS